MVASQNPFEDPEFLAETRRMGVQHKPGMAADLMSELAPLLKADGVDLYDPHLDLSEREIQAAMDRAIEQHNLALFTPIGRDRTSAVQFVALIIDWLVIHEPGKAREVLGLIEPEPQFEIPAVAQMIGVCLGMIDTWLAGNGSDEVLPVIPVPKWPGKARGIARDFLVLARTGRAFDRSDGFIRQHGGELVMHGAVIAATAVVLAVSKRDDVPVRQAFEGLMFASEAHRAVPIAYHAVDTRTAREQAAGERFTAGYAVWVEQGIAQEEDPHELLQEFSTIEERAIARGLNLHNPRGVAEVIGVLDRAGEGLGQRFSFMVLNDYVQFRLISAEIGTETGSAARADAVEWRSVGEMLDARISRYKAAEQFEVPGHELLPGIAREAVDIRQLETALQQSAIARGTNDLIAWLGTPRQVTSTGVVRRADIAHVAQMIGERAVGVAKMPEPGSTDWGDTHRVHQVQSMREVPNLMFWWDALLRADVIEVTSSRVRRGAAAPLGSTLPPEAQAGICSYFVEEFVLDRVESESYQFFIDLSYIVGQLLVKCLMQGIDVASLEPDEAGDLKRDASLPEEIQQIDMFGRQRLLTLERLGLLERGPDQLMRVVPALRSPVALGLDAAFDRFKQV